ncbi:MAG: hypothetical protein ABW321_22600 [Polyangiales bacterium]
MQLVDRIEKRRFVGREFLLWLWFESELFDATLSTADHGPFGLWLEKRLSLSAGKESTRIASVAPGYTRQAKAALRAGQLPDAAGIRIAWRDDETGFQFKAERLAVGGLKLRPPEEVDKEVDALTELTRAKRKPTKGKGKRDRDDEAHEAFYERMQLTEEFEGLLEALYADFKALRLSDAWNATVVPLLRAWAASDNASDLDAAAYTALRRPELAEPKPARDQPAGAASL